MNKTSIPRLHSVRFKDGRAPLRIFRAREGGDILRGFASASGELAAYRKDMAGYVVVAWGADGGTSVACRTAGNPIPIMLMPEFVKTCVADWVATNGGKS